MSEPAKMELTSMDVAEEKREEMKRCLGAAFPEVFAEGSIDFDQLKRVLGEWVDPGKERFGLSWPGKAECMKIIQKPSGATLKPAREESVDFDETENLFIEGDNLEVLKLLQKAYFGKIKMIYIDPPYNTGGEFIYPDKYAETLETYLSYTGQIDDEGRKFATNTELSGRYHSRWLSMMFPRLYLARNLLAEDGIILISIDDNEHSRLREICDSIFGEENFLANVVWKHTQQSKNDELYFSRHHNSILVYRKSEALKELLFTRSDEDNRNYSNPDGDPNGDWRPGDVRSPNYRETLRFNIRTPGGKIIPPPDNGWRWSEQVVLDKISTGEIVFSPDETRIVRKIYLKNQEGRTPENLWAGEKFGTTRIANAQIKELFDDKTVFDTPKPTQLIKTMMDLIHKQTDYIVMDFFAGSAATAQAVFEKNREDGGTRKWIMVQLPEKIDENADAFKMGFSTISSLAIERVRRAGKALKSVVGKELALKGTGNPDNGFKVFKLHASNFKLWDGSAEAFQADGRQLEMHVEHVSSASSAEDVLYELLLKSGFLLTTKVQTIELAGKKVFSVENGTLLICLEKDITPELIDALAEANPLQVICLDEAFKGNDQLKANAVQTFKARAQAEESEIVFKTV